MKYFLSIAGFSFFILMSGARAQGMEGMDMPGMSMKAAPSPKPARVKKTPRPHSVTAVIPRPPVHYAGGTMPIMDHALYTHAIFNELEGRYAPQGTQLRYDGQAWLGTDYDKLWIKSEGTLSPGGKFSDGDHEVFYDRAISTYFDLQGGVRADIDSGPSRVWGAFGLEGLALYFFDLEATGYVSGDGRLAAKIQGSYDFLLTNRLILQPQIEMNFYSRPDPARAVRAGLSDIDTGVRLRYEIDRTFAPYVGVTYAGAFGASQGPPGPRDPTRNTLRFTVGLRTWF